MKKFLLPILAVLCILTGCLHSKNERRVYVLDNPMVGLQQSYQISDFVLPDYLCSKEMRYTTANGELKIIPHASWALPLDRLLRDAAQDTLRHLPKDVNAPSREIRIDRIYLEKGKALVFKGEIVLKSKDDFGAPVTAAFEKSFPCPEEPDVQTFRNALRDLLKFLLEQNF